MHLSKLMAHVSNYDVITLFVVIVAVHSLSRVHGLQHARGFPGVTIVKNKGAFTVSQTLLKPMSIESVMPSNHLVLCHPLLLLPSIFPSIRVFPNESALRIRWPEYWSFSFGISHSSEHSGLILVGANIAQELTAGRRIKLVLMFF